MSTTPRYDAAIAAEMLAAGPEERAQAHERALGLLLAAEQELAALKRSIADLSHANLQMLLRDREEIIRARDAFEDAALRAASIGMAMMNVHMRERTAYQQRKFDELAAIHAMCGAAFERNIANADLGEIRPRASFRKLARES